MALAALPASAFASPNPEQARFRLDTAETRTDPAAPSPTQGLVREIVQRGDGQGRPFVVVDKRSAQVWVHAADGRLVGRSPALLGSASGDGSVPGVGERTQRRALRPEDRTTPAGRFEARVGRNLSGEAVVWVDWDAALAIHRLRDGPSRAQRELRLRSRAEARRVSDGCVVVPGEFFDAVVLPTLSGGRSTVYILPEGPGAATLDAMASASARQAM